MGNEGENENDERHVCYKHEEEVAVEGGEGFCSFFEGSFGVA